MEQGKQTPVHREKCNIILEKRVESIRENPITDDDPSTQQVPSQEAIPTDLAV